MNWKSLDECKILELADAIELRGQKWFEEICKDEDYIYNNRPIIEITSKKRCSNHYVRELGQSKMRVPFFWNLKEKKSMITIPLNYCKFCKKFMMQEYLYDKYKEKGEFLCRLMRDKVIINDLTEDMVIQWKKTGIPHSRDGLCSIDKSYAKALINLEKKRAQISVIDKNGNILKEDVPVYFSRNTGYYYIYTETVQRLKEKGIILCRLFSYSNVADFDGDFGNLNTESIIHQYGYNVSAIENLSQEQRKHILYSIIINNIATIEEIKNHLSFLIRVNKNILKMSSACAKWKEDFAYLDNIEIGVYDNKIPAEMVLKNIIITE